MARVSKGRGISVIFFLLEDSTVSGCVSSSPPPADICGRNTCPSFTYTFSFGIFKVLIERLDPIFSKLIGRHISP